MRKEAHRAIGDPFEVLYFSQDQIIRFLQQNPGRLYHKKFHELLVGWLVAQFLGDEERGTMYIGFPARLDWRERIPGGVATMDELLRVQSNMIQDTDCDVVIGNEGIYTKWQVARFTHPSGRPPHRRLAALIEKKCRRYARDPKLNLVVSADKRPHITEDELRQLLTQIDVPFGSILFASKASRERRHFGLCQLYPTPVILQDRVIPLPV